MKKILAICLAVGLLALSGCGKQPADSGETSLPSGGSQAESGAASGTASGGTGAASGDGQKSDNAIPGFKQGVYFGMTKAELEALEPELVLDENETEENWCAFETVAGTPFYDLAVKNEVDAVNSYTFINGKLATIDVIASTNQFTEKDVENLGYAYVDLLGGSMLSDTQKLDMGMVNYVATVKGATCKVTVELLTNIPADQEMENYLTARFEPVA